MKSMIIALFPNKYKKQSCDVAKEIAAFLKKKGITTVVDDENANALKVPLLSSVDPKTIDFSISLGGDGTILRIFHNHPTLHAPIFAINLGGLGFMADIRLDEIYPALTHLINGKYKIQQRMVIEGTVKKEKKFAVNDIVLHRATNPGIVDLSITVDDVYFNTFSGDGIIIATPSGSTAYSLSAGGPILTPELEAIVITPICPHSISNKPIVLLPKKEICIEYLRPQKPVEVIYDGFPGSLLNPGETLKIKRSKRTFGLVAMPTHDYFATLRSKLDWTGNLKKG